MAQRHRATGEFAPTGKTMEHGAERALPHFFFENTRGVIVRLARMDDQRQTSFARRGDVRSKSTLLRLARGIVIVIIEAGFADRHDLFSAASGCELGQANVCFFVRVMWMRADRAINLRKTLRYCEHCRLAAHA